MRNVKCLQAPPAVSRESTARVGANRGNSGALTRHRHGDVLLCGLLLALLTTFPVRAVVLLNEPFAYTNGPLVAVSGGNWSVHSPSAGPVEVVSERAVVSAANGEDVNTPLLGQPYPQNGTTNVFYAGMTVRFSALPTSGGSYFAHFNSSSFRGRIFALPGGAPAGQFRLGLSSVLAALNQTNPANLNLNTDYRVVLRLTNSTAVATLWVNPVLESDSSVTTTEAGGGATTTGFALRQTTSIGTLTVDDLVVATTFAEALSTNSLSGQPPGVQLLSTDTTALPGETVELTASATGAPPLSYQWSRGETAIPDATNATLTLVDVSVGETGDYSVAVTNAFGATNSATLRLTVLPLQTPVFSLLDFNLAGNGDPDWTTNNFQVRAIGRIISHLNPDIMTFQEIPTTNNGLANMVGVMQVYRPGFFIATNSGTDEFIHSVIVSRWPLNRSQSWLDGADLDPFGYTNGNFTRDLFEAEIAVPDFGEPLHVFTTHLKSGASSSPDSARRAAEAGAISNFLVNVFLPAHGHRPYVLTGDLNEDIAVPSVGSQQPIQRLVNPATGLRLTTPPNPLTQAARTFSIRDTNGLSKRYDYIMPGGLLYSNFAGAQVFRSDVLVPPPPNLFSNDSRNASDHLAVFMSFANPYPLSFRLLSVGATNGEVQLTWESVSNRVYTVERSSDLVQWTSLASNLIAVETNMSYVTNRTAGLEYFRIYRQP